MNKSFTIYDENKVYLGGKIENGVLTIISEIYDDDFNSEVHVLLTRDETTKLFTILSLDELITRFKNESLNNMLNFFNENKIEYVRSHVY